MIPILSRARWLLLLSFVLPLTAYADPKDDARRHFGEALQFAQAGDYQAALDEFLEAQAAYPHPITLYNIARSYQDLNDLPNAVRYFKLCASADPERADEIDPVVAVLEAQIRQAEMPDPVEVQTGGVAAATQKEIERLQQISKELEELTKVLQSRGPAVVEGQPLPSGEVAEPLELPEVVEEGGFLSEAYERVVVTASRVGQDPLDSPSSLTVLTAEDIRLSGALSVPDLLRRVVGVDVMSLAAGNTDVSIRGFNRKLSNKVLILIDGRSTYLDFLGTTFWSSLPIEMEEIERIEVIRGPGSAVYGANAVTGVINIITRTPGEGQQVARFDYGSPGVKKGAAVLNGRSGGTSYRMSAGFEQHGAWAVPYDLLDANHELLSDTPIAAFSPRPDRAIDELRINGRLDHTFNEELTVSISGGLSDGTFEFHSIGALPDFGSKLRHSYLRGDVIYQKLHLRTFWNRNDGLTGPWTYYKDQERDLLSRYLNDVVDVEVESPLTFNTGSVSHTLNIGGGYRYKRIATTYLKGGFDNPFSENHFKGFINEQAKIKRLSLVGSLRFDRHPLIDINKTISPRAAVIYRMFEKTSARASVGTAFRVPNSLESYMDLALPTPNDGVFIQDSGNRKLLPERITTYEVGLHDASSYYHTADVAVYVNQVSDLIYLSDVQRGVNPFDPVENGVLVGETGFVNLSPKYTGVGVEAEGDIYPTDGLDLFANLNVLQIIEDDGGTTVKDGSTSTIKVNAGAAYRSPWGVDLSFTAHYLSEQNWRLREFDRNTLALAIQEEVVPARTLLEARIAARPLENQDLEFAATLWNITELDGGGYIEHPKGQPVLGRAYGTVSYRF